MHVIDVQDDNSSISGYVVSPTKENLRNYLSEYSPAAEAITTYLSAHCAQVAVLKNLFVDESCRGCGVGSVLLEAFLSEARAYGASAVVLIADSAETQQDGFQLNAWYERWDFASVVPTGCGDVMVQPAQLAHELKAAVFPDAADNHTTTPGLSS